MERYFDLYLNAGVSVPLVINANQYDKSETWLFTLYDETGIQFRPASGSIVGLKADGNTIVNAGTVNSSGQVVIQETEQITAVAGKNEYELILDASHGTANFVVLVERRPGDNATPSESDLSLIEQAIEAASNITQVVELTNIVNSVRSEMTNFIADNAGLPNETTLSTDEIYRVWKSSAATPTGGKTVLSAKVTDYDVIAVYTTISTLGGSSTTPEAHYFNAQGFADKITTVVCGTSRDSATSKDMYVPMLSLICDSDEKTITCSSAKLVAWNGTASSDATVTESDSTNVQGSIVRITGIRNDQLDTEVVNARVGKDGTRYNTLKARLDAETAIVDSSLTVSGAAADSKKVGDEISDLKSQIDDIEEQIEGGTGSGLTDQAKQALLTMFQHVAFSGDDPTGRTYYNDLYDALYPAIVVTKVTLNTNSLSFGSLNSTQQLTATTTPSGGAVTWHSSNTSVATVSATGLVTAVGYGNATITATSGGKSATCAVTIAQATVTSISANYTQSGTVYDSASLDDLKSDLVVTANWSNGTTSTVASADYILSGTLAEGTSTITVLYGGNTATFNVTVTHDTSIRYNFTFVDNEYINQTANEIRSGSGYSRTAVMSTQGASHIILPPLSALAVLGTAETDPGEVTPPYSLGLSAKNVQASDETQAIQFPYGAKYFSISNSSSVLKSWLANGATGENRLGVLGWEDGVAYSTFELIADSYVRQNGYPAGYSGWSRTKFIDCHGAKTITFPKFTGADKGYNNFYDVGFKALSSFSLNANGNTVTVPSNAYYFVCSGDTSAMQSFIQLQTIPHGE